MIDHVKPARVATLSAHRPLFTVSGRLRAATDGRNSDEEESPQASDHERGRRIRPHRHRDRSQCGLRADLMLTAVSRGPGDPGDTAFRTGRHAASGGTRRSARAGAKVASGPRCPGGTMTGLSNWSRMMFVPSGTPNTKGQGRTLRRGFGRGCEVAGRRPGRLWILHRSPYATRSRSQPRASLTWAGRCGRVPSASGCGSVRRATSRGAAPGVPRVASARSPVRSRRW
jgi:hypothetical protein